MWVRILTNNVKHKYFSLTSIHKVIDLDDSFLVNSDINFGVINSFVVKVKTLCGNEFFLHLIKY